MNGGNCSSFCPVSRRRQKLLLPQQTMPLCGRQRPAACTGPALCKPPITTVGSGATASGTLPRWATHTSPQARLERWQGHRNLRAWHTGKLPAAAEVQGWRQHGPLGEALVKAAARQGRGGASIIHTQKLGARKEGEGEVLEPLAAAPPPPPAPPPTLYMPGRSH